VKADRKLEAIETLTSAQIRERIQTVERQIAAKQVEREALEERIPAILAEHTGSDLAAVKERRELRDLESYLGDLSRTRSVLEAQLSEANEREAAEAFAAKVAESKRLGGVIAERAKVLQHALVQVWAAAGALREADLQFVSSLAGADPSGFERWALSATTMRRIECALYVLSEGQLRPKGMFDSAHEMRESGRHDIARAADDYVSLALRGRKPFRTL